MTGWFIFDIETRVARDRVLRCEHPGKIEGQSLDAACQRVLDRICAEKGATADRSCFVPARFHEPVSIVGLLVDDQLQYQNHCVLAHTNGAGYPDVKRTITEWWAAIQWLGAQQRPTLVSFNGHHFDIPVLEVTGMEHGCDLSSWLNPWAKMWEDPRGDRAPDLHWDLFSILAKPGVLGGSLSYWARLNGLPGKLDTEGDMVQQLLAEKKLSEIADYNACDVLNTYGVLFNVLHAMRRLPMGWKGNPVFTNTVERVIAGRGPECQRFAMACSGVPF